MSLPATRERRPSFGPTVYHDEEEVTVKRPPRVFYEEVAREKPRRSSSVNSYPATAHHENARKAGDITSPVQSPNKAGFVESVIEKQYIDDEKGFIEKPFTADEKYYTEPYGGDRNSHHRGRRGVIDKYFPPQHEEAFDRSQLWWSRVRHAIREPLSEFFGVFVLVLFGDGAIAQVVLSKNTRGDWQSICWGWGLGVMLGVYVAGISGSNINPAVTFTNCVFRKHPWHKFPVYLIAQVLGAFCAAGVVYANYKSAIDVFEGGVGIRTVPGYSQNATAGIFATYPQPFMTQTGEFFSEFICATLLMFTIYALKDEKNRYADKFIPLILFFVVFGIGACFGWETGFAINMARDFGPRLMTYCLGYGNEVWTAAGHYFWIPMVAPFLGCLFGAWLYDMFLYTGESPVNTPYMGLQRLLRQGPANDNPV
ncbi:unnamed protein product [Blumeria hordei]|uniref:Aquaporin n=2 Tax=Blumeria hordei TaxID=2867405 RepID=A0A383UTH2_BLUHO|nr:aquaglyceroporin [Blumeria hordei DH14]SZF03664.1 unnamed protein product [Blumeria hordei]